MNIHDPAAQFVSLLATALTSGTLDSTAQIWQQIAGRLGADRTAGATLVLFESDAGSADLQRRMAAALETHFTHDELRDLLTTLSSAPVPQVRSRITAGEEALIQDSGHKVVAADGPVDLETSAAKSGQIIGSPITIIGAGAPAAAAPPSVPVPRPHISDPTLSADGVHFTFSHALLIGVAEYHDPRLTVYGATTANDVRELGAVLRDPQHAAYPVDQVRVLADAKATRANILDALEELAHRAAGDTALIMFAGHGEPVAGSYALLPYDTDLNNLAGSTITAELFQRQVAKIRERAQRLVVLLNCCHAGGIGDTVLDADPAVLSGAAPPPEFYRPLAQGSGQVVISSSRPEQKSGARSHTDRRYTTFGAHLLDALRGKAPGNGHGIGVFDLFAHLRRAVPADARNLTYRGGPLVQEPLFYASQLDDNLAVALRPAGGAPTLAVPDTLVQRLIQLELQIEASDGGAVAAIIAERDQLLTQLASG